MIEVSSPKSSKSGSHWSKEELARASKSAKRKRAKEKKRKELLGSEASDDSEARKARSHADGSA